MRSFAPCNNPGHEQEGVHSQGFCVGRGCRSGWDGEGGKGGLQALDPAQQV